MKQSEKPPSLPQTNGEKKMSEENEIAMAATRSAAADGCVYAPCANEPDTRAWRLCIDWH